MVAMCVFVSTLGYSTRALRFAAMASWDDSIGNVRGSKVDAREVIFILFSWDLI